MPLETSLGEAVERAGGLTATGERRFLGITGPPGSGKSRVAAQLATGLGGKAALVPMDGFHLANEQLERLGRRGRKGAPDTFDVEGYQAVLTSLRDQHEPVIYAPAFDRSRETVVSNAIPVRRDTPLVITEGNYLLLQDPPWTGISSLLDEVWYLEVDDAVRMDRLVARHLANGKSEADARAWATGTDERNAVLISSTRHRADVVVQMTEATAG